MNTIKPMDLGHFSESPPEKPIHTLFIHHSTGGQLLSDKGSSIGNNCIYKSHPNGGGLRRLLEENHYIVHEASYGSLIGEKTDICDWKGKFRDQMNKILVCMNQDTFSADGTRNRIVIFKSCFPNSWIASEGKGLGDPDSCERTTANYKATYNQLLEYFRKHPDTLFVVFTAPPLVEPSTTGFRSKMKEMLKTLFMRADTVEKTGERTRAFNNWLKNIDNGWLKGYDLKNVVVFDYYDILTGYGKSNWLKYPTRGGKDSHPSNEGQSIAARDFISFLNRAVHRMGL